ncbi:HNH endonuclease [Microbacterium sp. bgisy203]|uniref:HNH endonuclease n=1 Tax=Microbacterium sp. bgisy203 TaxID=3413799 RepID=UPI003D744F0A
MALRSSAEEAAIRQDVFRWLDARYSENGGYELSRKLLESYRFNGEPIKLLDTGRGIRNPASFSSTLTIMTSAGRRNPYEDSENADGWVTYHYQSSKGGDNVKLARAVENRDPIVYFKGVRPGFFVPFYPVVISHNDPIARVVRFPLDQGLSFLGDPLHYSEEQRRYADGIVRTRLHQPIFRAQVLHAYASSCTVCELKHSELLDAAHIAPDADSEGVAHVSNGLAMCKIHHAAYDRSLMGITPDYEVRIDQELLDEIDGPMLRHGLQDMHGKRIVLPSSRAAYPDRDRLAKRFEMFASR